MSDDNNFTLGDILWEYADYTPPEPTPRPSAPKPAAAQPLIPSPQPAAQPKPAQAPAQPKPAQAPTQPAAQPKPTQAPAQPAAQPKPAQAPAQPAAQPKPTQAPAQPAAQPKSAETPAQPEPQPEAPEPPAQTGVPKADGPELIGFTSDPGPSQPETPPQAAETPGETPEAAQEESPAHEEAQPQEAPVQEAPAQEGQQEAEPAPPPQPGPERPKAPPTGGKTAPGPQPQPEPFQLRRERKARKQPEAPPDAPAAQLALEYGQGLKGLKSRCIGSIVVTGLLLLLSFLESGLSLAGLLRGFIPDAVFLPIGLALFVVVVAVCLPVLKNGLVQLTNKAPNGDTLALLATVFTLADGLSLLIFGLRPMSLPFFAPCALVLTFHLAGQYLTQSARYLTCRTAASVAQPYVVTQDQNVLSGQPSFRKWLGQPKGFGSQVRTLSEGEFRFQRLTPVLLTACVVLPLITTVAHRQPWLAFWSFSALFTAAATLSASLVFSLPLRMLSKRLAKLGVALAGWPGAAHAKGCRTALLGDYDVYPPGSVTLTDARPFGNWTIDKVVSYAASAVRSSGSGLTYLFDRTLRSQHGAYMNVEKLVLQDNGILAQIQGQQVLLGNSDFLSRQGVTLPQGVRAKDTVFCAIGPELAGMFSLRYDLHPAIPPALRSLFAHKFYPVLATRDFNLTPQRLRLRSRLPVDQIAFPDLQRRVSLSGPHQVHSDALVAVLCKEGLPPFAEAIIGAKRIRRAGRLTGWFAAVSACVGVVLTATLSSAGALSSMCAWNLSLYLLLWFVPVLLLSLWTTKF